METTKPSAFSQCKIAVFTALIGELIASVGIFLAIYYYNKSNTAPFSPLNHFISELGWKSKNQGAWAFNTSVVMGGIACIPLLWEMGRHIGTRLGWIAVFTGIITVIAGSLIGFVSMDRMIPHLMIAFVYFWSLPTMVILFILAFWLNGKAKQAGWLILTSCLVLSACTVFIAFPKTSLIGVIHHANTFTRPRIWALPILEWGVLFSANAWVLTAAAYLFWNPNKEPENTVFKPSNSKCKSW